MIPKLFAGVAELADAPDLGSGINRCGGSSPFARTTSERILLRSDFCLQKNQSHAPSFLLFREKSRSVACSFVNAHATAHNRCQLFTILRLRRSQNSLPLLRLQISPVRTRAPCRSGLCSVIIFFLYKNNLYILTLHLFRKRWMWICKKSRKKDPYKRVFSIFYCLSRVTVCVASSQPTV